MWAFHLEMRTFYFEMHKVTYFYSNLLVSWELVTEGYQGRPVKCAHFERPLPGMVISVVMIPCCQIIPEEAQNIFPCLKLWLIVYLKSLKL